MNKLSIIELREKLMVLINDEMVNDLLNTLDNCIFRGVNWTRKYGGQPWLLACFENDTIRYDEETGVLEVLKKHKVADNHWELTIDSYSFYGNLSVSRKRTKRTVKVDGKNYKVDSTLEITEKSFNKNGFPFNICKKGPVNFSSTLFKAFATDILDFSLTEREDLAFYHLDTDAVVKNKEELAVTGVLLSDGEKEKTYIAVLQSKTEDGQTQTVAYPLFYDAKKRIITEPLAREPLFHLKGYTFCKVDVSSLGFLGHDEASLDKFLGESLASAANEERVTITHTNPNLKLAPKDGKYE